jgi:hypothetical protein
MTMNKIPEISIHTHSDKVTSALICVGKEGKPIPQLTKLDYEKMVGYRQYRNKPTELVHVSNFHFIVHNEDRKEELERLLPSELHHRIYVRPFHND